MLLTTFCVFLFIVCHFINYSFVNNTRIKLCVFLLKFKFLLIFLSLWYKIDLKKLFLFLALFFHSQIVFCPFKDYQVCQPTTMSELLCSTQSGKEDINIRDVHSRTLARHSNSSPSFQQVKPVSTQAHEKVTHLIPKHLVLKIIILECFTKNKQ